MSTLNIEGTTFDDPAFSAHCNSCVIVTAEVIKPALLVPVLRKAFDGFDHNRSGSIPCDFVADILRMMGQPFNKKILEELIEEVDADSEYCYHFTFP